VSFGRRRRVGASIVWSLQKRSMYDVKNSSASIGTLIATSSFI
jgi:hypothetical protein